VAQCPNAAHSLQPVITPQSPLVGHLPTHWQAPRILLSVKKLPKLRPSTALVFETLDQRLLYSADLAGVVSALVPDQTISTAEVRYVAETTAHTELVVIDSRVHNASEIEIKPGQQALVVDASETFFDALARWNAAQSKPTTIDALHLVAHGQDGSMQLGRDTISSDSLRANGQAWAQLGLQMQADADILIYACDFAASARGEETVQLMAELTHADVAASRNISGASSLGADWTLEYNTGAIETATLFHGDQANSLGKLTSFILDTVGTPSAADAEELTRTGRGDQIATNGSVSVVAWYDPVSQRVLARQSDANAVQAPTLLIVSTSGNTTHDIAVAMGSDGRFAVTWIEDQSTNESRVYVQRYNANGSTAGTVVEVDDGTKHLRAGSTIAINGNNQIAIAWEAGGLNESTMLNSKIEVATEAWNTNIFTRQIASGAQLNTASVVMQATAGNDFVLAWVNQNDGAIYSSTVPENAGALGVASTPILVIAAQANHAYMDLSLAIGADGTSAIAFEDQRSFTFLGQPAKHDDIRVAFFGTNNLSGPSSTDTYTSVFGQYIDPSIATNGNGSYMMSFGSSTDAPTAANPTFTYLCVVSNQIANAGPGLAPTRVASGSPRLIDAVGGSALFSDARNTSTVFIADSVYVIFDGVTTAAATPVYPADTILRIRLIPPALVVSPLSTSITNENGSNATFSVALNDRPIGNVTVTITSSNPAEGSITGSTTLTFTTTNWNTPQTVTLAGGARDFILDGDQNYQITITASDTQTDPLVSFNGLTSTLSLVNRDVDTFNQFLVTSTDDTLHLASNATAQDYLAYARSNPNLVTLRDAIVAANSIPNGAGGPDQIRFATALKDQTISLLSALPDITSAVDINGNTGSALAPEINLQQSNSIAVGTSNFSGLHFASGAGNSRIQALAFAGFTGSSAAALAIDADNITVDNNWFGINTTGTVLRNNVDAIQANGTNLDPVTGLIVSNNRIAASLRGLTLNSTAAAAVWGNKIGITNASETGFDNLFDGIKVNNSTDTYLHDNVILENAGNGIDIALSTNSRIENNQIGQNTSGSAGIAISGSSNTVVSLNQVSGNDGDGIRASNSTNLSVLSNTITSNGANGIHLVQVATGSIGSNKIGLSSDGNTALGNGLNGILVEGASSALDIGSNTISANGSSGVYLDGATAANIHGNIVGLNSAQTQAMGNGGVILNGGPGITITGVSQSNIINDNTIAGNINGGIRISGSNASSNRVYRNYIGINASQTTIFSNGAEGVSIYDGAHHNVIGSTVAGDGNIIVAEQGIRIFGSAWGIAATNNVLLANKISGATYNTTSLMTGDWNSSQQIAANVNDVLDADTGVNGLANTPVFTSLQAVTANSFLASFSLDAQANTSYIIEFNLVTPLSATSYQSAQPISTVTVTTNASGHVASSASLSIASGISSSQRLVATATRLSGSTPQETSAYSAPANQAIIIPSQNTSVAEMASFQHVLLASDPEGGAITWAIASQTIPGALVLDTGYGAAHLQFTSNAPFLGNAPDAEASGAPVNNVYSIVLTATDVSGLTVTKQIDISILNVVETPVLISPAPIQNFPENFTGEILDLATFLQVKTDLSATGPLSYSILPQAGTDFNLFAMNVGSPSKVMLQTAQDFENPAHSSGAYSLLVRVTDSLGGYLDQMISLQLTDVSEAASIATSPSYNVAENSSANSWQIAISGANPGATYTWSLSAGDDQALFSIDAASGLLSFNVTPNYEAPVDSDNDNIYLVTVNLVDQYGQSASSVVVVYVTNVNEAPQLGVSHLYSTPENNGPLAWTQSATDPDAGEQFNWSIVGGADASKFTINALTGVLQFSASTDFESPQDADSNNLYEVQVRVTDAGGLFSNSNITLAISNVNEDPAITSASALSSNENVANPEWTLSATDPDAASTQQWTIVGGADAAHFSIDAGSNVLQLAITPNFEAPVDANGDNLYSVLVQVTDAGGLTHQRQFDVQIQNVNEAPVTAPAVTYSADENTPSIAWTQTASDQDAGDQLTWSIVGGADAAKFALNASTGVLTFAGSANFEAPADADANNTYLVELQVRDSAGSTANRVVTLVINNVNETPAITTPGAISQAENAVNPLWNLVATDPDGANGLQWSIAGGADAAKFSVNTSTGALQLNLTPDFESPVDANFDNVYSVIVHVIDAGGLTAQRQFDIQITNGNEPPITDATTSFSANENQANLAWVLAATDPDTADQLTWSIIGGADASKFTVNQLTGELQFSSAANYEAPVDADANNTYLVQLEVRDPSGNTANKLVTLSINDVNETPAITTLGAQSVGENTVNPVLNLAATDEEGANALQWSIVGGADASKFSVNANTGALQLNLTPNFESPVDANSDNVYSVIVQVIDAGGLTAQRQFDLQISNVNEAPVFTSANAFTVNENTASLFQMVARDPDAGANPTYSIIGGADASLFTITPNTGRLKFAGAAATAGMNFEAAHGPTYTVIVSARDALGAQSADQTVTVSIVDVNEAVSIGAPPSLNSAEDSVISFDAGSGHAITLADEDQGQLYQITATATNGVLRSNATDSTQLVLNGSLTQLQAQIQSMQFVPSENYSGSASLSLQIVEQQAGGKSATHTIAMTITPTDDPLIIVRQTTPTVTAGGSVAIGANTLTLHDNDVSSSNIVFRVSTIPTSLTFSKGGAALSAGDTFTQADIDAGLLQVSSPITALTGTQTILLQAKDASSQATPLDVHLQLNMVSSAGPAVDTSPAIGGATSSSGSAAAAAPSSSTGGTTASTPAASSSTTPIASPASSKTGAAASDTALVETPASSTSDTETAKAQRNLAAASSTLKSNNNVAPTITSTANSLSATLQLSLANNVSAQASEGEKALTHVASNTSVRELGLQARSFTSSEERDLRREALRSVEFTRDIDNIRREVQQEMSLERAVVGSSVAVTTSVSIGYVIWLLRGGVLLSSLLATLPAWRSLDPFPVLAGAGGHDEPAEDDSLQGMLKRAADKVKVSANAELQDKNNEETA
jgi:parallel beta-helix repeat protein